MVDKRNPNAGFESLNKAFTPAAVPDLSADVTFVENELINAPERSFIDEKGVPVIGMPVPVDIYKMYTGEGYPTDVGYNDEQIARSIIEVDHNLPDTDAVYENLLSRYGTDEGIIQRLASDPQTGQLYRRRSQGESVFTNLARGAGYTGAMMTGAKAGSMAGPYGAILGGAGALVATAIADQVFTDQRRSMPSSRNVEMGSEFFGSGYTGAFAPFLAKQGAVKNTISSLINDNVRKLPYLNKITNPAGKAVDRLGDFVERGFEATRQSPKSSLTAEGLSISTGTGAGLGFDAIYDNVDPTLGRAGTETVGALVGPGAYLRFLTPIKNGIMGLAQKFNPTQRKNEFADAMVDIIDQMGVRDGPFRSESEQLVQLAGEGTPLDLLMKQQNIDPGNPTIAERTNNPALLELQAFQARQDPQGFGARVQNRAVARVKALENLMGSLIYLDTPETLGALAELRVEYFANSLQAEVGRAYELYENELNSLLKDGNVSDELTVLYKHFNDALEGARVQEQAFYNRIPKALETDASFTLDALKVANESYGIATQNPRLDSGQNPLSIRIALQDFKEILAGEGVPSTKIDDIAKEEGVEPGFLNSKFVSAADGPAAKTGRNPLPDRITSGDLVNLREIVIGALRREKSAGQGSSVLAQSLGELDIAIRQDLEALDNPTNEGVTLSLNNALDFSDALNDTFKRSLVGEALYKNKSAPEVVMKKMLLTPPDEAALALRDVDNAVNFLNNQLIEGLSFDNEIRNQILSGNFIAPPNASEADQALFMQLSETPLRQTDIKILQNNVIRGLFQKFKKRDGEGNLITDDAGITNYLDNPENIKVLEIISPPVQIDGVRKSPLIDDLQNVEKRRVLFNQVNANDPIIEAKAQIPMSVFMGIEDNPGNAIRRLLGVPGPNRPDNAIRDFQNLSRDVARVSQDDIDNLNLNFEITPEELKQNFYQTVISEAFTVSRGDVTTPFSFKMFKEYMTEPILPGNRRTLGPQPSPLRILETNNIIDRAQFSNFNRLLDAAVEVEDAINSNDVDRIINAYRDNPVTAELVQRIVGAKIGTSIAGAIGGGGSADSLIAASAGSKALRTLLNKAPNQAVTDLWLKAAEDDEFLLEILNLGIARKRQGKGKKASQTAKEYSALSDAKTVGKAALDQKLLTTVRAALTSLGYTGLPSEEEVMQEAYGASLYTPPGQRPSPGNLAGFRREQLRNQAAEQARVQGPVPPPMAMTDQAQQFLPQGPSSAPTAPNPQARAQFAAMFPDDITSNLIKADQQGIMSLNI